MRVIKYCRDCSTVVVKGSFSYCLEVGFNIFIFLYILKHHISTIKIEVWLEMDIRSGLDCENE